MKAFRKMISLACQSTTLVYLYFPVIYNVPYGNLLTFNFLCINSKLNQALKQLVGCKKIKEIIGLKSRGDIRIKSGLRPILFRLKVTKKFLLNTELIYRAARCTNV